MTEDAGIQSRVCLVPEPSSPPPTASHLWKDMPDTGRRGAKGEETKQEIHQHPWLSCVWPGLGEEMGTWDQMCEPVKSGRTGQSTGVSLVKKKLRFLDQTCVYSSLQSETF